ncbi:hybrid sensor histidine kinase/response regulator [Geminocystis sp. NIES-3709]|uniref:hybrid sensor histidine kinase/response regulator n=1 Tax=Geminocystis sp. NIES-3709 TaxID=1617448 RepID=UPI0005FC5745|nr:hybrid sensor histidine kinase/response regulator [Geminocystis sp. NIES-3709]BAQ66656.1 circadian input kinase A [Geminocystis sp. NIES-3709]
MNDSAATIENLHQEVKTVRQSLADTLDKLKIAEETLQAIHSGEVDAVVVATKQGMKIFTLQGADHIYQRLVEQMGEGAATISNEGLILYSNQRLSELLHCPLKNVIGSELQNFIALKDRKVFSLLLQHLQPEETFTIELSLISATENREVPVQLSLKQFNIDKLLVNSIIITDITESKTKEATKLTQILNSAIVVIYNFRIFIDGTLEIDSWGGGTEKIFGYSLDVVKGDSNLIWRNILSEDRENAITSLIKNIQSGNSGVIEYRFCHGDGTTHWLNSNHVGQWDEVQDCWTGIDIITDITEKKQLEKQFYHAQRLESLGTLASGIAHDFNNILTPILGVSQLLPLTFPNLDEKGQRLLNLLSGSAKRGVDLVKQILLFSRATEGQCVALQLGYVLLELIGIAQQTFPKSINISAEIPTRELWTILADATQMHQVFMNLMINARDAMSEGGNLTIIAENYELNEHDANLNLEAKAGSYVVVTIEDTGMGIPSDLLERIFDPFFTTKDVGKGTGLGLSTVTGLVKNHDGFVKVYSELGKGAKFQVFLPAIEGEVSLTISEEILQKGNGELILIVDDETSIQEVTKISLENYNYKTIVANDGIEAISFYEKHQQEISVILMDMMMPNLDGITAIRSLKKINPQVKIIASSGLIANRELALEANVSTFLSKPYTVKQLLQTLTEIIGGKLENIHQTSLKSETHFSDPEILKEALRNMPPEWLKQMYDATYCVDADVMLELIAQIPPEKITLANALKDLVDDFNTDIIMNLIGVC